MAASFVVVAALAPLSGCADAPPDTAVTVHLSLGLAARSYQIRVLDAQHHQVGTVDLAPGDNETIHVRSTELTIVVPGVCTLMSRADGTPIVATIGTSSCAI